MIFLQIRCWMLEKIHDDQAVMSSPSLQTFMGDEQAVKN